MSKNRKVVIFDLDNCISHDQWRIPLIRWDEECPGKRYKEYHKKALYDEYHNRTILQEHARLGDKIAIITSRPVEFSNITYRWLLRNKINYNTIYFRPFGDHRHSVELKEDLLCKLIDYCEEEDFVITMAYDDREDIVNMYKLNGIDSKVLKIHESCAYSKPK